VWLPTAYGRSQFSSKWGSIFNMIHGSASFCKAFNRQIRGLSDSLGRYPLKWSTIFLRTLFKGTLSPGASRDFRLHVSQVTLEEVNFKRTLIHVPLKIHVMDTGTSLAAVSCATS
jgi:hypothetical protein